MNLNRRVDDDDNDDAKKAADDQEEIGLGQISKAPATRLKLHLDLAPEDVDRERLSGRILYPEWDTRSGRYLEDHVCVLASVVDADPEKGYHCRRPARRPAHPLGQKTIRGTAPRPGDDTRPSGRRWAGHGRRGALPGGAAGKRDRQ
ncbi:hypothetical protein QW131_24720 [Roseibium salinum]|nr:hypothetical protein [Roseibium salinum]